MTLVNRAFVSIGSNIDRERNVLSAVRALRETFGELQLSPVYASTALGFDGDDFFNMVVAFDTELPAKALADQLDRIEAEHGRTSWEKRLCARTLDLDLLLLGDQVIDQPGLRLPRADILRYAFVLKPLADMAPELEHPVLKRNYRQLWEAFPAAEQPLRLVELRFQ